MPTVRKKTGEEEATAFEVFCLLLSDGYRGVSSNFLLTLKLEAGLVVLVGNKWWGNVEGDHKLISCSLS